MPEKPVKNKSETEVLDFNNPAYKFVSNGAHEWRQRGPYLVCVSCELQHAVWVGVDKQMVGMKDGKPILKRL